MKNKKKPNTRINKNKDLKIETHNKTTKLSEIRSKDTDESVNKIKKTRTNKKKAVFIVLLILIIFYALFLVAKLVKNPTDTFVVTKGKLTQEETVLGYIAREETVVKGANYKNGMVKIKDEGAKVAKDDSIFRYYSVGEEELKSKIAKLDVEMQQIMQNEEGAFSSDIKLLENQVEKELNAVYEINSIQKIQEHTKNINSYIAKKAKISGELSPSGSYLKQLLAQRQEYENQLIANSEYIKAPVSGIVSYRVDGLEDVLKVEDFSKFNKEFLHNLDLKTGQTVALSEEMGKIINNYQCYIIFNSKSNEAKNSKVGDTIKIRLQNSNVINATIENIINEEDKTKTITIKITKNIEDLISYRKISFDIIWWSEEGYKIPTEAIKEEDGKSYIIRNRNGYYDKMLIKILKQNDEYCIVEQYFAEELKELGFTNTQIYNMKNIALYDEILLNP